MYCLRQTILGGIRLVNEVFWKEYVEGKQIYLQLAGQYSCSVKTIQRLLDRIQVTLPDIAKQVVVILMDTTYFKRDFGVMLFKDAYTGKNLHKRYVKTETIQHYADGVNHLLQQRFITKAIVCDGRKGLLNLFNGIPIQMCQFHHVAINRRYLTKKPKMQASK